MKSSISTVAAPFRRITQGPLHHMFGYYDKHQWDISGRYLLGIEASFVDRLPEADDVAVIGLIDSESGDASFQPVAETRSWSWQQSCMLQWMPRTKDTIIYNDRVGDHYVAVILNVQTGSRRTLPRPIYAVSNDEKWAVSLNFSRLARTRPECGYPGIPDFRANMDHPSDDGIYLMDLETGNHELVVSLDQLAHHRPHPSMEGLPHWVNHLLFDPTGKRFAFFHRWPTPDGSRFTRMFTIDRDGRDMFQVPMDNPTRYAWRDENHLLAWGNRNPGETPDDRSFYLFQDRNETLTRIFLAETGGHMTYSPDGRWLLTGGRRGGVLLYRLEDSAGFRVGSFPTQRPSNPFLRCDHHARWNRTGSAICLDSDHEGTRQMYVIDVGQLTHS